MSPSRMRPSRDVPGTGPVVGAVPEPVGAVPATGVPAGVSGPDAGALTGIDGLPVG
jgi:hypothetical protein